MENKKIFEYFDFEDLLEKVPYDPYEDNEENRSAYVKKIFSDYNFYEIGKKTLSFDLEIITNSLGLHSILQYLYGCVNFYTMAFYYFSEKKNGKIVNDYANTTIRKIGENLMQKAESFCYLFFEEDYSDAISISRSIYELVLSAHLIYEYPQLAEPYRDKERYLRYKFEKEFIGSFYDCSVKKEFYSILDKYGNTLNENFGWTAKVFPNKEERFHKNLAKKMELHAVFDSCYQQACAYVHSAPYSLIHQELKECLPFSGWVVEMLYKYCSDFFSLSFMSKKEKIIMNSCSENIVLSYINELTKFYTKKKE